MTDRTDTDAATRAKKADRITKLLTLAADPAATDDERQTAYAKAADLMTRNGITEAQIRAARGETPEPIEVYPYAVSGADGYGDARATVAYRIAEALGCRPVRRTTPAPLPCLTIIVGARSDLATLRALLPLVMVQAERAAVAAARTNHGADFVPSFLAGYGHAVADRIRARRQTLATEAATAGTGADVILRERDERVRAAYDARFGDITTQTQAPRTSAAGMAAGHRAGRRADLGDSHLPTTTRAAIPGNH